MSRYRRVWVVYRKELVETLRDRRTLIAMVVVPIVLYPVLMVVLLQALRTETSRREAEHYSVCVPTEQHRLWLTEVLNREDRARDVELAVYKQAAEAAGEPVEDLDSGLHAHLRAEQVTIEVRPGESLWEVVSGQECQVAVIVEPPPDPANPADQTNRVVQVIYRDTDPRSEFVYDQLSRILTDEADRVIRSRVAQLAGSDSLLNPIETGGLSTASPAQQFAKIIAMVMPFLLVTMTVTGAMYPAIDLTAGERERGTLETLAVSPVPTGQIVAGKFGVIVTIAMLSTLLNLGSMTAMVHFSRLDQLATSRQAAGRAESLLAAARIEQASRPDASMRYTQRDYLADRRVLEQEAARKASFLKSSAPIVLLAMIPFAVLFGGVMLAVCSFARTFKEAQNYMMPVMMAALLPAMVVSYMPTVKLEGVLLVLPVANVVVLMRELFLGNYQFSAMAICLLSTSLYAVTAVAVAARVYGHEAVLFSDVGSYKTLLRRRFIRPQPAPSAAFVLLTVAVMFPVNFYWQSYMLGADAGTAAFRTVVSAAQVFIFAVPALVLCWYVKANVRETFSLRVPLPWPAIGAVLLAFSILPVSHFLEQVQFRFFPPSGELTAKEVQWLTGGSLASVLLVFAVIPGICEELLFRGFLMGGLRRKLRALPLVLLVGLVFGLYHVTGGGEKIPIVSLLGMLLAFVCLRADSIVPAMFVHMANNGLALLATRSEGEGLRHFYGLPDPGPAVTSIHFGAADAAFLVVFLVGLALVGWAGESRAGVVEDNGLVA